MKLKVILPYPPSANRYWRVYKGMTVVSSEATAYKREVKKLAKLAALSPLRGDVALTLDVYRPRATGDLDNRIKVLVDSLNGIAWADDEQIVQIHAYRHEGRGAGRVEVTIEPVGGQQSEMEV